MNIYTINWFLLLILSAIWGGAFTLNKYSLEIYSPEVIVAGRLIVGALLLVLIILIRNKKIDIKLSDWRYYGFMSMVGIVIPFLLISYGQIKIDSSLAGILMATMPISTILLSHIFLDDESLTGSKLFGFLIAFLGIIILIMPEIFFLPEITNDIFSELMVISGAILYSCSAVYGKKYKITNPLNASTGTIFYSAVAMLLYLFSIETEINDVISYPHIISIASLGIFCTAIATIIYFQILQTSGASFISIMNYLIPIWSIIFGVIFLQEGIYWNYFLGLIIIIYGIKLSQKGIKKPQT